MKQAISLPSLHIVSDTTDIDVAEEAAIIDPEVPFLSSCIDEGAAFGAVHIVVQYVHPEDFLDPWRAAIFRGIVAHARDGVRPTPTLLDHHLREANEYTKPGGHHLLVRQLVAAAMCRDRLPANVGMYAVAVVDGALRRNIRTFGAAILESCETMNARDRRMLLDEGHARIVSHSKRLDTLRTKVLAA